MKKTTEMGQLRIVNMLENTYTATVNKLGYKEQVITFNINSNETTRLNIEMEKV